MKSFIGAVLLVGAGLGVCAAHADTRIVEVWTCMLNEGKTQENVQAVNKNGWSS